MQLLISYVTHLRFYLMANTPLMLRICKDGKKKNKTKPVNVNRQISPSFFISILSNYHIKKNEIV